MESFMNIELLNMTGFNIDDKVFVKLTDNTYYGIVLKIDSRLDRIRVKYSQDPNKEVSDWFHKSFWSKVTN